jgi:hypothetical protein
LAQQIRDFKVNIACALLVEVEQRDDLKGLDDEDKIAYWGQLLKFHEEKGIDFKDILWEQTELVRQAKEYRKNHRYNRKPPQKVEYETEKAWQDDIRAYLRGYNDGYGKGLEECNAHFREKVEWCWRKMKAP